MEDVFMSKGIFVGTLLALFVLTQAAFSQTVEGGPERENEAVLVDSFGRTTNGMIRSALDSFMTDLYRREKGARGVVVNYGTVNEVEARKRLISNHALFRNFDKTLFSYVQGGNVSEFRTDLWIVPKGAEGPKLPPEAFVVGEMGRASKAQLDAVIRKIFRTVVDNPSHRNYIINYGSTAEIVRREKVFTSAINFRNFDRVRITLVRGGRKTGPRTVFWSIPPGAVNPVS